MIKILLLVLGLLSQLVFANSSFDRYSFVTKSNKLKSYVNKFSAEGFTLAKVVDVGAETAIYPNCPCRFYKAEFRKFEKVGDQIITYIKTVELEMNYEFENFYQNKTVVIKQVGDIKVERVVPADLTEPVEVLGCWPGL